MKKSTSHIDSTIAPRVFFFNRYYFPDISATSQILTDLAEYLARNGFEVIVITSRQTYEDPAAMLAPFESHEGVQIRRLTTPSFGRRTIIGRLADYIGFYAGALIVGLRLVKRGNIVIAKTDPPLLSVIVAMVALARKARLMNWLQDVFPEIAQLLGMRGLGGAVGTGLKRLRNWTLRGARCSVVIGERMREFVYEQTNGDAVISIIQNWANEEEITPIQHSRNPMRRNWDVNDYFVVGYSGNLGRAHEIKTLLIAAEELRHSKVRFVISGGGALLKELMVESDARLLTNFLFKPYQPRSKLAESLSASDVHLVILRPELEGLIVPSKIYGIMAAGRPVIFVGAATGEIAKIIQSYECGLQIDVGDGIGLANAIRRLASSAGERVRMGQNARDAAVGPLAHGRAFSDWEVLLHQIGRS